MRDNLEKLCFWLKKKIFGWKRVQTFESIEKSYLEKNVPMYVCVRESGAKSSNRCNSRIKLNFHTNHVWSITNVPSKFSLKISNCFFTRHFWFIQKCQFALQRSYVFFNRVCGISGGHEDASSSAEGAASWRSDGDEAYSSFSYGKISSRRISPRRAVVVG